MTQEENLLLTKDLCARLPYRVKCYVPVENCTMELTGKRLNYFCFHKDVWGIDYSHEFEVVLDPLNDAHNGYIIKPYLRPMSSMTEEECDMVEEILGDKCIFDFMSNGDIVLKQGQFSQNKLAKLCDYYASIHVDYRGLIEKSLAIEVTEENNPYE